MRRLSESAELFRAERGEKRVLHCRSHGKQRRSEPGDRHGREHHHERQERQFPSSLSEGWSNRESCTERSGSKSADKQQHVLGEDHVCELRRLVSDSAKES